MTEQHPESHVKHEHSATPVSPEQAEAEVKKAEEKKAKEKEERRNKEKEAVKKQVEDAAAAHIALGSKFLAEDQEEAEKKAEAEAKKAEKK